eukprot:6192695-Pleurochrysis_carterae.AAC.1
MLPAASIWGTVLPAPSARTSIRSVRNSYGENGPLRGMVGGLNFSPARSLDAGAIVQSCVRACARARRARQRDLATFPYVGR